MPGSRAALEGFKVPAGETYVANWPEFRAFVDEAREKLRAESV